MKFLFGKETTKFSEAATVALQEARTHGMSYYISTLFKPVLDTESSETDGWTAIIRAIQRQYGKNCRWWKEGLWYVAIPNLGCKREPIPCLEMRVGKWMVACVTLDMGKQLRPLTVVHTSVKLEKIILPLRFLLAIVEDDLAQSRITGKEDLWTTWEITGVKKSQIRLHDTFVQKLSQILETKSVDRWLSDFGDQSHGVIPLVVSDLLSLLNEKEGGYLVKKRAGLNPKELEAGLRTLGYSTAEAEIMIRQTPDLRVDDSTAEALTKILRHQSKGG